MGIVLKDKFYLLVHNTRILEVLHKILISLDSGIFNFTNLVKNIRENSFNSNIYLFTIEFFPFFAIKFQIEILDKLGISKVDKSISKIAAILIRKFNFKTSRVCYAEINW